MDKKHPHKHMVAAQAGYSSPPCFAHEWDTDRSEPPSIGEIADLFTCLLTAEQVNAEIVTAYLDDGMPDGAVALLGELRTAALGNCGVLRAAIGSDAHESRHDAQETSRALLIRDPRKRLEFLAYRYCRGAQQIRDALPHIESAEAASRLKSIYTQHLTYITAIEELLAQ